MIRDYEVITVGKKAQRANMIRKEALNKIAT